MELQAGLRYLVVLCVFAALLSACESTGDSSESPQPLIDACYAGLCEFSAADAERVESAAVGNGEFILHWTVPQTRTNGEKLSSSEIMGYVLLVIHAPLLDEGQELVGRRVTSPSEFRQRGEQLAVFLRPGDVEQLLISGSEAIVLVYPPDLPFRLNSLPPGEFYVAVAAIDNYGQFSELSNTLKLSVH